MMAPRRHGWLPRKARDQEGALSPGEIKAYERERLRSAVSMPAVDQIE
jgi:hypothetical protein